MGKIKKDSLGDRMKNYAAAASIRVRNYLLTYFYEIKEV